METPVIKASDILADLQAGLTRPEIKQKYNLNGVQLANIFKTPSLRGKRTIKEKGVPFQFIDDIPSEKSTSEPIVGTSDRTASLQEEDVSTNTNTEEEISNPDAIHSSSGIV